MPMNSQSRHSPGRFMCGLPFAKVVSLWILMNILTSEGRLQEKYIGCFYDEIQATVPGIASFSTDDALTIDKCIARCQTLNTTYAALQNGNICQCRKDSGVQLSQQDSSCYLICSGDKHQICGGFIGKRIAYSLYTMCPIGTYGAACDKGCHCKRDIPCNRMTGNCPDGCYEDWSGPACNNIASQQYIGCYVDTTETRALEVCIYCDDRGSYNKNNTIQSCIKSCAENSSSYAGLQYSYQCFCGDRYDRYGTPTKVGPTCNMSCSGDSKAICGGAWANSVYSVCPIGNYGKSCAGRCHCLNNERCLFRNGSCPSSQCEPGWTGPSCSIRDCSRNNGDCFTNETCTAINLTYSTVSLCSCSHGFQRTSLQGNCTDTDECSLNVCDPDSMICTNTIGSYNCFCRSGFREHNTTSCIDIDECSLNVCDADTTICTNTIGSYDCSCRSGFQPHNATTCTDIDECQKKSCDSYPTTDCKNTPGSYTCICKQWFWSFNGYNCTGEIAITAGVIGFITGLALSLAIAFAFIQICSRRKYHDSAMPENKSNISMPITPDVDSNGDEAERYVSRPCKPKVENFSSTKPTAKGIVSGKGKPGTSDKVREKVRTSTKDEEAFNAAPDINTYESFTAGASGIDETGIYTELKLYK